MRKKKKKRTRPPIPPRQKTPEEIRNARLEIIITFAFTGGLLLGVWEVFLFRRTIIDVSIPLVLWLTPGMVLTPIFYRWLNQIDNMRLPWIPHFLLHYLLHTCIIGSVVTFSFMAINYYGADPNFTSERFEILEKSSLPGSKGHRNERLPTALINYHGLNKEIVFKYRDTERFRNATYVILYVKRGLLGYDILDDYDVANEK